MSASDTLRRPFARRAVTLALWVLPLAALANIAFFLWTLDGRPLAEVVTRPGLLIAGAALTLLPWLTNMIRVAIWAHVIDVRLGAVQIARIVIGTVIANSITPTTTGGTVIRWGFYVNEGVSPDRASTLVSMQVAEDTTILLTTLFFAVIFVSAVELPSSIESVEWVGAVRELLGPVPLVTGALIVVFGGLCWLALFGRLGIRAQSGATRARDRLMLLLHNMRDDWRTIARTGKRALLLSFSLGIVQWIARYSVATLVLGAVGAVMLPVLYWVLQWLTYTISAVIPTPGGIGGAEASFLLLYAPFVSDAALGPAMVIWRLMLFYLPTALAAVLFLLLRGRAGARPG